MMRAMLKIQSARYAYHQLQETALCMFGLTEAERRIAHCLLSGMTYEQVAELMHLSRSSIKGYARTIFEKASVKCRIDFERHIHRLIERL